MAHPKGDHWMACNGSNWGECSKAVTHIDEKGFTYCENHGPRRRDSGYRCRKLTPKEYRLLESGQPIPHY